MEKISGFRTGPWILLFVLMAVSPCFAGEYLSTSGAEVLNLDTGARQVGLGGAFVSMADDPQALFYNPAGLGQLTTAHLALSHINLFSELSLESLAADYPLAAGSLGLGLHYVHSGEFDEISNGLGTGQRIYFSSFLVQGGYGIKINRMIHAGLGLKYLSTDLAGYKGSALALDAGLLLGFEAGKFYNRVENNLKVGISLQNFGTRIRFIDKSESLPQKLNLGVGYKPFDFLNLTLEGNYWLGYNLVKGSLLCLGAELAPDFFITPRVGLRMDRDFTELTLGIGVGSSWNDYKYRLDMAYAGNADLGSHLYFTLNLAQMPFYQFRREERMNPDDLPRSLLSPGSAMSFSFSQNKKTLNARISSRSYADTDLAKLQDDLVRYLGSDLGDSGKIMPVKEKEDILLTNEIKREQGKYRLEFSALFQKERSELKKITVRFSSGQALEKISRRITDTLIQKVVPLFHPVVSIQTSPSGGEIFLNDRLAGRSPWTGQELLPGEYKVRVKKTGYKIIETNIEVNPGPGGSFSFDLFPEYQVPDQFNISLQGNVSDPGLKDLDQAFQMLFRENLGLFKEYVRTDEEEEAQLALEYTLVQKGKYYSFHFKLRDLKKGLVVKESGQEIDTDSKLVDVVNDLLNSLMDYVMKVREMVQAQQEGFIRITGLIPDSDVRFNGKKIRLPFSGKYPPGSYALEVYREEDLMVSKTLVLEPGNTNKVMLLSDWKDDFQTLPGPEFWEKPETGMIKVRKGRLLLSSREDEKNELMLLSHEFLSVPFQVSLKFESTGTPGARFYFGLEDSSGACYFIRYEAKGYEGLCFKKDQKEKIDTELITDFKEHKEKAHELILRYENDRVSLYVDDLLLKDVPAFMAPKIRFSILGTSEAGMDFSISDLRLKLLAENEL